MVKSVDMQYHQQIVFNRSPEAKRIELLKHQNLSCKVCNNFSPLQGNAGKCAMKKNKIVSRHNICHLYGQTLLT